MDEDQAFVVMQVGAKDTPERKRADEVFEFIVRPALGEFGIKPYRADLDPTPGGITAKMLSELLTSKLVIADLSGRNPNVFYELGIAHSFARPLISIVDSVDTLPFDTKDQRVIELGAHADSGLGYAQGETAKKALIASLRVVLADEYEPPSPVREVAGSQSLDALAPDNPFASELSGMRETIDEIRAMVQPRTRPVIPPSMRADQAAFRDLVERLAVTGRLSDQEAAALANTETSVDHDNWVGSIREVIAGLQDDPWGSVGTQASGERPSSVRRSVPSTRSTSRNPFESRTPSSDDDEPPF